MASGIMWSDVLFPLAVVFVWLCLFTLVIWLARRFARGPGEEPASEEMPPEGSRDRNAAAG